MYDKSGNISLSLAFAKAAKNGEIEDRKKIKKKWMFERESLPRNVGKGILLMKAFRKLRKLKNPGLGSQTRVDW